MSRQPASQLAGLAGGKLYTGNFERRDADGDLFFVGRGTDSMRVRGENVSGREVECVLTPSERIRKHLLSRDNTQAWDTRVRRESTMLTDA